MQASAGITWLTELLFHSMIFNLVCFVELVAVNFGMVASAWLLANDQVYATEQKRMRSEQEELSRTCGSTACSSRASASALETQSGRALEERDEEGAGPSQEVRIGGHLYALGNAADKDSKSAGEEEWLERNAVASARKVSIATRIKVALDADGDGNVSFCELVCQNSVPGLTLTPNPNPNPKPNPILNPNP